MLYSILTMEKLDAQDDVYEMNVEYHPSFHSFYM